MYILLLINYFFFEIHGGPGSWSLRIVSVEEAPGSTYSFFWNIFTRLL